MMLSSILFLVAAALLPPLVLLRVVYQMAVSYTHLRAHET